MQFTYEAYKDLIGLLIGNGYEIISYRDQAVHPRCAILRHDVDVSDKPAIRIAEVESSLGVHATFFFMLTSELYNALSRSVLDTIGAIAEMGHEIGLHFDESIYPLSGGHDLIAAAEKEAEIFRMATGLEISAVSMHMPSENTLQRNDTFPTMRNAYGHEYIREYKYLSDSNRHWREDVLSHIQSGDYSKLHILTHPVWYNDTEKTKAETLRDILSGCRADEYEALRHIVPDLEMILPKG